MSILADGTLTAGLSSITGNLNSRGFHCVVEKRLAEGQPLMCILRLPNGPPLRCRATVVWVKPLGDGRMGIGCRIDDYSVGD